MTVFSGLLNPAGGLTYHLRSLRQHRLWEHHRKVTCEWLSGWRPQAEQLVLIGPSAGYSLPDSFLRSFTRVIALDPDPLALGLLRLRFPALNMLCRNENYLVTSSRRLWTDGLQVLKAKYQGSAFLFCNIVGQLPLLTNDYSSAWVSWAENFKRFSVDTEWASYHDLWSAKTQGLAGQWAPPKMPGTERIKKSVAIFLNTTEPQVIHDHETSELFSVNHDRLLWTWQRTKTEVHCIEGVRESKQFAGA